MNDDTRTQHSSHFGPIDAPRLVGSRHSGDDSRALVPLGKSSGLSRMETFGGNKGNRGGMPTGGAKFHQWANVESEHTPDGGFQVKGERHRAFYDPDRGLSGHSHETGELHSGPEGFSKRIERFKSFQDRHGNTTSSTELSHMQGGPGGSSGFKMNITEQQQGDRKLSAMSFETQGMGRGNLKFSLFQESHGDQSHGGSSHGGPSGQGGGGKNSMGFHLDLGGGRGLSLSLGLGQGGGHGGHSGGRGLNLSLQHGKSGGSKLGLAMGMAKFGMSLASHGSSGKPKGGAGTKMSLSLGHGGMNLNLSKGGGGGMKMSMSLGGGGKK